MFGSLDLDVDKGKRLALVGHPGGGKSSVIKLLLRFYDTTSGSVTHDGRDIRSFNVAWYRSQVRLVLKSFSGDVDENLNLVDLWR